MEFFTPEAAGRLISSRGFESDCFGVAIDMNGNLIATYFVAAETTAKAMFASAHAGESLYWKGAHNNSHIRTVGTKFITNIARLTDSSRVSGMVYNVGVDRYIKEAESTYVVAPKDWDVLSPLDRASDEQRDFYNRVFDRLNQIVDIPIHITWIPALLEAGKAWTNGKLVWGIEKSGNKYYNTTFGFRFVQLLNLKDRSQRDGWTEIVQSLLRNRTISIPEPF